MRRGLYMMNEQFELHQAKVEELELVEGVLIEAAKWIKLKGSKQWSGLLAESDGIDNHDMRGALLRGDVYYGTIKGKVGGVFLLWDKQSEWDQTLWGEDASQDYMYLHRLAIKREYAGTGLSQTLVQSAINLGKEKEKKAIRLDCVKNKEYLNRLYQKAGFKLVSSVEGHDAGEQIADFNLYQYNL